MVEARRINGTVRADEVADVFRRGKFELLAISEAKLKGNGEASWCGVNGIIIGAE